MLLPKGRVGVVQKGGKHTAVPHIMAVDEIVAAPGEAVRRQKGRPADGSAAVKGPAEVEFLLLGRVHHRVVDGRPCDGQPPGQVLVLLPQGLVLGQDAALRGGRAVRSGERCLRLMHLFGKGVVGRLLLAGP